MTDTHELEDPWLLAAALVVEEFPHMATRLGAIAASSPEAFLENGRLAGRLTVPTAAPVPVSEQTPITAEVLEVEQDEEPMSTLEPVSALSASLAVKAEHGSDAGLRDFIRRTKPGAVAVDDDRTPTEADLAAENAVQHKDLSKWMQARGVGIEGGTDRG